MPAKNPDAMNRWTLFLLAGMMACSTSPVPLRFGQDGCDFCKMTLMDQKFGAEIVTTKGKIYRFDDVNCMMQFLDQQSVPDREVQHRLVVDFTTPGVLVEAPTAHYVKSPFVKSPMGSEVAAFAHYDSMNVYRQKWKGIYLTWGELVTQYKEP